MNKNAVHSACYNYIYITSLLLPQIFIIVFLQLHTEIYTQAFDGQHKFVRFRVEALQHFCVQGS
jgi:hypothetical protein